jgi:hypothetical protein
MLMNSREQAHAFHLMTNSYAAAQGAPGVLRGHRSSARARGPRRTWASAVGLEAHHGKQTVFTGSEEGPGLLFGRFWIRIRSSGFHGGTRT